jgi:hypothetical protein
MTFDCSANIGVGCCFRENLMAQKIVVAHTKEVSLVGKNLKENVSINSAGDGQNVVSGCPN